MVEGNCDAVPVLAFSPSGEQLASGYDGSVQIWDASSGRLMFTLGSHCFCPQRIKALAFSHSGDQLASCVEWWLCLYGERKNVRIWDPSTGSCLKVLRSEGCTSNLSYSADGTYIKTDSGVIELERNAGSWRGSFANAWI